MKQQNRKLALRMRGEDVRRLQAALGHLGFSIADSEGYFGKTTRQAVLTFQEQHDLEPTGVVDEEVGSPAHDAHGHPAGACPGQQRLGLLD